jgi:hypothetical protein
MRALSAILTSLALASAVAVSEARAAETVTASIAVNVQIASRTSLKVSSEVVRFNVAEGETAARASIEFRAGARVASGVDVVLTVEPLHEVKGPGGAADIETSLSFDGGGDGVLRGRLDAEVPTVAGRWQGSGLRQGRLFFTIHANAAGTYTLPVRFVLSTP